jgi:hypothetical protein
MAETTTKEPEQSLHERAYAVTCLVALLVVVVMLMLDGMGVWSVLPMLVGGVAFLLRWRSGPPIVVFLFMLMAPAHRGDDLEPVSFMTTVLAWVIPPAYYASKGLDGSLPVEDVLLAVGLVTYVAACYRSLALSHSVIPPEFARRGIATRGPKRPLGQPPSQLICRPDDSTRPLELPILFGALGVSLVAGWLLWWGSGQMPTAFQLSLAVWRNVVAFWVWVLVVSLSLTFFRYLGRLRAPTDENVLYLQDQLWRQTRHEQGAVNRWLVWARLRWQRRKEK